MEIPRLDFTLSYKLHLSLHLALDSRPFLIPRPLSPPPQISHRLPLHPASSSLEKPKVSPPAHPPRFLTPADILLPAPLLHERVYPPLDGFARFHPRIRPRHCVLPLVYGRVWLLRVFLRCLTSPPWSLRHLFNQDCGLLPLHMDWIWTGVYTRVWQVGQVVWNNVIALRRRMWVFYDAYSGLHRV